MFLFILLIFQIEQRYKEHKVFTQFLAIIKGNFSIIWTKAAHVSKQLKQEKHGDKDSNIRWHRIPLVSSLHHTFTLKATRKLKHLLQPQFLPPPLVPRFPPVHPYFLSPC